MKTICFDSEFIHKDSNYTFPNIIVIHDVYFSRYVDTSLIYGYNHKVDRYKLIKLFKHITEYKKFIKKCIEK